MYKNIKNVAIIFQNQIQYDSAIGLVDIMMSKGIKVDIYVPTYNGNKNVGDMYEEFYKTLDTKKYHIFREAKTILYDLLFETYESELSPYIKRKYTIKYPYGLTTKGDVSLSLLVNYIFDGILCYGDDDAECSKNFGVTFKIGNIKYLKTKTVPRENIEKKTILYLPTYGDLCSIEEITEELLKLKNEYNIIIKPHHATEYKQNEQEENRRKFIKEHYENVYSSKEKLENLLNKCDVVLTDTSGAIFDAVSLKKPPIMYYKKENEKFGDYVMLPIQCIEKGYIQGITKDTIQNLKQYIERVQTEEYKKKQEELFKKLFICENNESGKYFEKCLEEIDNGIFETDYSKIHKNMVEDIKKLYQISYNAGELTNEINKIYNSKSWKIITKIRNIKNIFKKNKNIE